MARRTIARGGRAERVASWIADAFSTGNPLGAVPEDDLPRTRAEGERIAFRVLEELGIPPCGVRVSGAGRGALAGPMVEGRLQPSGTPLVGLRHSRATAALVGVLGASLEPGEDGPPVIAAVHPAIDVADSRFTVPPAGVAMRVADVGGLGQVVIGDAAPPPPDGIIVAGAGGPVRVEVRLAFAAAAAAARRLGGLPAGAVLVVAGLAPLAAPDAGDCIEAGFGALGTVRTRLAAPVLGLPG
ncbi:hypothetical protein ACE7GA_14010 [Roseomonas sp. CCTCC AB2023176]|uniref:hypothetical protein n=1 Tax=Roseomonas sp. CCTCC AB2023176 TaxID=3342640 RepID=UPI0035DEF4F6